MKTYSRVSGEVSLFMINEELLANGIILLKDGYYKGYGQYLSISKGKLSYINSKINNPGLDIDIVKELNTDLDDDNPESLEISEAGIRITGTALNPKVELFSLPQQLTNDEILSLILLGNSSSYSDGEINYEDSSLSSLQLGKNILNSLGILNNNSKNLFFDSISINSYNDDIDGDGENTQIENDYSITLNKKINNKLLLQGKFTVYSDYYSVSAQYKLSQKALLRGYFSQLNQGLSFLINFNTN